MGGIVVQVCRAKNDEQLQALIGAATEYWSKEGFTKVDVSHESDAGASVGMYTMEDASKAPKRVSVDLDDERTAVLVISKA